MRREHICSQERPVPRLQKLHRLQEHLIRLHCISNLLQPHIPHNTKHGKLHVLPVTHTLHHKLLSRRIHNHTVVSVLPISMGNSAIKHCVPKHPVLSPHSSPLSRNLQRRKLSQHPHLHPRKSLTQDLLPKSGQVKTSSLHIHHRLFFHRGKFQLSYNFFNSICSAECNCCSASFHGLTPLLSDPAQSFQWRHQTCKPSFSKVSRMHSAKTNAYRSFRNYKSHLLKNSHDIILVQHPCRKQWQW